MSESSFCYSNHGLAGARPPGIRPTPPTRAAAPPLPPPGASCGLRDSRPAGVLAAAPRPDPPPPPVRAAAPARPRPSRGRHAHPIVAPPTNIPYMGGHAPLVARHAPRFPSRAPPSSTRTLPALFPLCPIPTLLLPALLPTTLLPLLPASPSPPRARPFSAPAAAAFLLRAGSPRWPAHPAAWSLRACTAKTRDRPPRGRRGLPAASAMDVSKMVREPGGGGRLRAGWGDPRPSSLLLASALPSPPPPPHPLKVSGLLIRLPSLLASTLSSRHPGGGGRPGLRPPGFPRRERPHAALPPASAAGDLGSWRLPGAGRRGRVPRTPARSSLLGIWGEDGRTEPAGHMGTGVWGFGG